jgi:hypothetical protein
MPNALSDLKADRQRRLRPAAGIANARRRSAALSLTPDYLT